jgi:hypothetical protein
VEQAALAAAVLAVKGQQLLRTEEIQEQLILAEAVVVVVDNMVLDRVAAATADQV